MPAGGGGGCKTGWSASTTCVKPGSDNGNCGGCGIACAAGEAWQLQRSRWRGLQGRSLTLRRGLRRPEHRPGQLQWVWGRLRRRGDLPVGTCTPTDDGGASTADVRRPGIDRMLRRLRRLADRPQQLRLLWRGLSERAVRHRALHRGRWASAGVCWVRMARWTAAAAA